MTRKMAKEKESEPTTYSDLALSRKKNTCCSLYSLEAFRLGAIQLVVSR